MWLKGVVTYPVESAASARSFLLGGLQLGDEETSHACRQVSFGLCWQPQVTHSVILVFVFFFLFFFACVVFIFRGSKCKGDANS